MRQRKCVGKGTEGKNVQPESIEKRTVGNVSPVTESAKKERETDGNVTSEKDENGKVLVAYFSWAENAVQPDIDVMTSASVKAPENVAQSVLVV